MKMRGARPNQALHFQELAQSDDADQESLLAGRHGDSQWNSTSSKGFTCSRRVICFSCIGCVLFLIVLGVLMSLFMLNPWALKTAQSMGAETFGVHTDVSSVNIDMFRARASMSNIEVHSPPDFGGVFFSLGYGVFDARFTSMFSSVVEIQEMALRQLRVNIDQRIDGDSNAKRIMDHVAVVSESAKSKQFAALMKELNTTVTVDRLHFQDISIRLCMHPVCDKMEPQPFVIKEIRVNNIGQKSGGVNIPELMEIILRSVVLAGIHAAPQQQGSPLLQSLGASMVEALDYAEMHYDLGSGLQQAGTWTAAQLGGISKSAKAMGSIMTGALQESAPAVTKALEKTFGVSNPTNAQQRREKLALDANANKVRAQLETAVGNFSGFLSAGATALGQNVTNAIAAASNMLKDPDGAAPGKLTPQQEIQSTLAGLGEGAKEAAGSFEKMLKASFGQARTLSPTIPGSVI
eukprot:TRINITY_DN105425_c0_g1_i1.p1 TRINITY_DN105425_c0_g1~~TRINITY_DN105425_c0_g1_i1.p1  ORF type:complete len:464 (-),score=87.93 TRINITY_DN105425_c0_g1_i1:176-1567(-)